MREVGFVGLGAMGLPMARNLVRNGLRVRGFDAKPEALRALESEGGLPAGSAAEACSGADLLVLMVVNAEQAEAVLFGAGALAALPEGAVVCLMATCAPEAAVRICKRVEAAKRRFIDAPVSGGVAGAQTGTLTIMAASEVAVFEAVRPVLSVLGDKLFHVGHKPGQGAAVKTVNQLLCGVHIAVAAEALSLAERMDVDPHVLLEILGNSAASSWMLRDRGPRMISEDPEVRSAVDIFVKDLGIVLQAGQHARVALPLAALAHQLFLAASGRGLGRADDSQVISSYRALDGRRDAHLTTSEPDHRP